MKERAFTVSTNPRTEMQLQGHLHAVRKLLMTKTNDQRPMIHGQVCYYATRHGTTVLPPPPAYG